LHQELIYIHKWIVLCKHEIHQHPNLVVDPAVQRGLRRQQALAELFLFARSPQQSTIYK
jgi:hypothetical protein